MSAHAGACTSAAAGSAFMAAAARDGPPEAATLRASSVALFASAARAASAAACTRAEAGCSRAATKSASVPPSCATEAEPCGPHAATAGHPAAARLIHLDRPSAAEPCVVGRHEERRLAHAGQSLALLFGESLQLGVHLVHGARVALLCDVHQQLEARAEVGQAHVLQVLARQLRQHLQVHLVRLEQRAKRREAAQG
jgi:hypothetical protein